MNSIEIGDDEFDNEQVKATKDYQKYLLLLSKLYNEFYTNTASVFGPMIKNLKKETKFKMSWLTMVLRELILIQTWKVQIFWTNTCSFILTMVVFQAIHV